MANYSVANNTIYIGNGTSHNVPFQALLDEQNQREKSSGAEEATRLKIFCFDISSLSQTGQFLACCVGVFVLYLIYGYLQELIFTLDGFKPYGWYLTLIQFGYYTVFGFLERRIADVASWRHRNIPLRTYCILALLTLGTMGLSNSSLGYLNYPTQVIFKCCKLIPVLIGSIIIQKKQVSVWDMVGCEDEGQVYFDTLLGRSPRLFRRIGHVRGPGPVHRGRLQHVAQLRLVRRADDFVGPGL